MKRLLIGCTLLLANATESFTAELRNEHFILRFSDDLSQVSSLESVAQERQYIAKTQPPSGSYKIRMGYGAGSTELRTEPMSTEQTHESPQTSAIELTAVNADKRQLESKSDELRITSLHNLGTQGRVIVTQIARISDNGSLLWQIEVVNQTAYPVASVAYPIIGVGKLGESGEDDAFVFPDMEGSIGYNPIGRKLGWMGTYPGPQSMQFGYYFDEKGGLYSAALDASGSPKSMALHPRADALDWQWVHRFSEVRQPVTKIPYPVMMTFAGGRWENGAELYRSWARLQPWCANTALARRTSGDMPDWLFSPHLLVVSDVHRQRAAEEEAAAIFRLQDYYKAPVLSCLWSWEAHGIWVSPRYFPPINGKEYYESLSKLLNSRKNHLYLMMSGFRWVVQKPTRETINRRRHGQDYTNSKYEPYNGYADFFATSISASAVTASGLLDFRQLWWNDVYMMCAGSKQAEALNRDAFREVTKWGVTGTHLDQDLGGRVEPCWSLEHGHPPGYGHWQQESLSRLLTSVRATVKAANPNAFITVEEPCETLIPLLDAYFGRNHTDGNRFPVGKNRQALPLFSFVYHPYFLGVSGPEGYSALGNERINVGRMFLHGMHFGIWRHQRFFNELSNPDPSALYLRQAIAVATKMKDYLYAGDMQPEPKLHGAKPMTPQSPDYKTNNKDPWFPTGWSTVQATTWKSPFHPGIGYAVANLSSESATIGLSVGVNAVSIRVLEADLDKVLPVSNGNVQLVLSPWQCIGVIEN